MTLALAKIRKSEMSFSGLMYLCGIVCLILAPFTGLTIVGAAAFFVIGWIIDHA